MVHGERRALTDSDSEQRTHWDAKLPSGRPNTSPFLQREVQRTEVAVRLRAYGPPCPCSAYHASCCLLDSFPALLLLPRDAHHAQWCLALVVPSLGSFLSPEHQAPWPAGLLVSFCPFTC